MKSEILALVNDLAADGDNAAAIDAFCYRLRSGCGPVGGLLADALYLDWCAAREEREGFRKLVDEMEPTQSELFDVCEHTASLLDSDHQKRLVAAVTCRINGH